MGPLIPLFWTSGKVLCFWLHLLCIGFSHLQALSSACNRFFRFTSGTILADLLVASMAAEPFHPHTCKQALVGLESRITGAAATHHVTRRTLYQLSYAGLAFRLLDGKRQKKVSLSQTTGMNTPRAMAETKATANNFN